MSSDDIDVKKRAEKAALIHVGASFLKVPQAMRAAGFSDGDSQNPTLQQRVRRIIKDKLENENMSQALGVVRIRPNPSPVSDFSSNTTTVGSLDASSATEESFPLPRLNTVRSTASAAMKKAKNKRAMKKFSDTALKAATALYHDEQKKENGMSAKQVERMIKARFSGEGPCARSITRYVNEYKLVGTSPLKNGRPGEIPPHAFDSLCVGLESYISICQNNKKFMKLGKLKLAMLVNAVVDRDVDEKNNSYKLLSRIAKSKNIHLDSIKTSTQEARRILWTKAKFLVMWFNTWEANLIQLGFGKKSDVDGGFEIPDDQLVRILNFDETCCSTDGSGDAAGGRPEAVFYNPNLPFVGRATSKSSSTTTMITGSNAAGEAIPPHFQFMTSAQSEDAMRMRMDMAEYFPDILCKFGRETALPTAISYGMNEKGGMDEKEFEKYIKNSILHLYPDACDVPGKRVIIKVDSGPGRLNTELLAELRLLGFYLYPGVPNTTAVTQETDRNYGPFKSRFRRNLGEIVDARIMQNKSVSIQPWLIGMIVFGGTDPETGFRVTECAFTHGFSKESCLKAWAKVGAAPLTRKCLSDPKVSRTLGDDDGGNDEYLLSIQTANDLATHALDDMGYNGKLLRVSVERDREDSVPLTLPHSKERIEQLRKATTHSSKFLVTQGDHLTNNDHFIAAQANIMSRNVKELLMVKRQRMKAMQIREAAQAVMAKWEDELRNLDCQKLTVADVECLLRWYGAWRGEKMSKSEKVSRLVGILEEKGEPPTIEEWTADDEGRLQSLQNNTITLGDTAVGRKQVLFEQQMVAASITMSEDQWNRCVEMRKQKLEFEEVGREYEMATAGSLEMGEQVMEEHEVGAL